MIQQNRRDFLKTSGFLVVSATVLSISPEQLLAQASGPYPDPDFLQLDSWIVIRADNTATFKATNIGPNQSHIHFGTTGNWFIRSAANTGFFLIQ